MILDSAFLVDFEREIQRKEHGSAVKIKEMGSRYLFICLSVWLEKYFSRGDYRVRE